MHTLYSCDPFNSHTKWPPFPYAVLTALFILYYDQQMHNYFTNYHTATCFDTIVSPSES